MKPRAKPPAKLTVGSVLKDIITENDGHSVDIVRVLGLIVFVPGVTIFFWAVVYSTIKGTHFDFLGYGAGIASLGSLVLMLATGVSMKARTDQIGNPYAPPGLSQYPQQPPPAPGVQVNIDPPLGKTP